ncbi:hypothetical protein TeGR_g2481 [Tetraparma gracilis]|uniref:Uncharacterized protein n=1 Tax=Tetraparma gracilis TaxID=2962635 RepID=A0ABQ6MD50_9STRA|nr:hypothetical protein TeGR_g2481 [Tetraparma gracilis]
MSLATALLSCSLLMCSHSLLAPSLLPHRAPTSLRYFDDPSPIPLPSIAPLPTAGPDAVRTDASVVAELSLWLADEAVLPPPPAPGGSEASGSEASGSSAGGARYHVLRPSSLVGSLASFWRVCSLELRSYSSALAADPSLPARQAVLAFPPPGGGAPGPLAAYEALALLDKCVGFAAPLCHSSGLSTELEHYHPRFRNAPSLLYVARHAPVPTLMLKVAGPAEEAGAGATAGTTAAAPPLPAEPLSADRDFVTRLEHLYNRAAASSSADRLPSSPASRNAAARAGTHEEIVRRAQTWVELHRSKEAAPPAEPAAPAPESTGPKPPSWPRSAMRSIFDFSASAPPASPPPPLSISPPSPPAPAAAPDPLRYASRVHRWSVTDASVPEDVYAFVWAAAAELEARCQPAAGARPAGGEPPPGRVLSAMVVAPRYHSFNAEAWKRFGVTVNACLARLTGGRMWAAGFHPEYVCGGGGDSGGRRMEFPTLQICCELGEGQEE